MPTATQMFEVGLDVIKGWFQPAALDHSAPLDATLLEAGEVVAGRVAVINDNGDFVVDRTGGSVTNETTAMPIYLWNGSRDFDVVNYGVSPITDVTHWQSILPDGVMSGLVATGGYEIQTTEFDDDAGSGDGGAYLPNELLSSDATGVVTGNAEQYVDWVCGVASWHVNGQQGDAAASGPVGTNAHGIETLTFWTYFLPAASERPQ